MGSAHSTIPVVQGTPVATERRHLDIVFTIDCTGSMGDYIRTAKSNIANIVSRLVQTEGYCARFALVGYRDHPPQDYTFVTHSFGFTSSVDEMAKNLCALSAQGGGDGPEAVATALQATLEQDWREGATKVCILIADAPPHGLGEEGDGFPDGDPNGVDPLAVIDEMSKRSICIYAVGCQPALSQFRHATDFFVAAARRTNGQAVSLRSADRLPDIITGGAIEEMDLDTLADRVRAQVAQIRQDRPGVGDDECKAAIYRSLTDEGQQTRQLTCPRLTSVNADVVCRAQTLAEASSALRRIAASHDTATGFRSLSSLEFPSSTDVAAEPSAVIPETPVANVELNSAAISAEQVHRLFDRGRRTGRW